MLRDRVLSSIVMLPIVGVTVWAGGWWFTGLIGLIAVGTLWELCSLLRKTDFLQPITWLGLFMVAWLVLEAGLPADPGRFQALLIGSILVGLVVALLYTSPHPASDWAVTLGVAIYLGVTLRHLALLRNLADGLGWLATAALVTWITDSGAYFIGRSYGRHKLWPRVSPKKSWEGLIAGLIIGTTASALLAPLLVPSLLWQQGIVIGLLIGITGPFGDLSESLFKRQVGVKDSSNLIPGHGGLFDRIDSFIFVGPVIFWLARFWGW